MAAWAAVGTPEPGRRRWLRRLLWTVVWLVVLALVLVAGGGWYFSGKIRSDALYVAQAAPPDYRYEVLAASAQALTLELPEDASDDLVSDQVLGVVWKDGYGQVGALTSRDEEGVTRSFTPMTGGLPPVGELVALDAFAFPADPEVVGVPWEVVSYASGLGPAEAWYVPGERTTWAIFVHGRGASPAEALRALPTFAAAGFPGLLITYRNDPGAVGVDDRLARFGVTEWEDLEGAVRYAREHGAEDVVLVGYSMGGAIVASFLLRSELAAVVEAVVLDAPALSLNAMVDARAADTDLPLIPVRVPLVLTVTAKWMASWRFGVNWRELNYVARADDFAVPILLLHGDQDEDVPLALAEALAAARPDLVRLEVFPGAGHVKAWNVDPERYQAVLADFLERVEG